MELHFIVVSELISFVRILGNHCEGGTKNEQLSSQIVNIYRGEFEYKLGSDSDASHTADALMKIDAGSQLEGAFQALPS